MRIIGFSVRRTSRVAACCAVLALVVGPNAGNADGDATIYQWTDANGTSRYTPDLGRVPLGARDTVVTILSSDEGPSDTPIYFEPDPRASEVAVPDPNPEADSPPAVPTPSGPDERADRIRVLEAEIAQHEEALKAIISEPGSDDTDEIPPELREIADRLPRLQAELAALQQRPAGDGGP